MKTPNSQSNPGKKNKAGGIRRPDFKLYYKAILIKTVRHWHKNGHIDQWNRIESPEINSSIYDQLIFNKGAKKTQWGKYSLLKKWCWENWRNTSRNMKLDPCLTPLAKINLKRIKDLNISPDNMKVLEEDVGKKLLDIGLGNDFFSTWCQKDKQQKQKSSNSKTFSQQTKSSAH